MIVNSMALFYAIFLLHFFLLVGGPILLFRRGRFITGGVVALASTPLPILGQTWFTDSDSPALGALLMVEVPLAAIVLIVGITFSVTRLIRRRKHPAA